MKVYSLIIRDKYPEPDIISCDGPGDFFTSYNPTFQRHLRDDGFLFTNSVGGEKKYFVDIEHHSSNERYLQLRDCCIKYVRNKKIIEIIYV